MAMKKKIITLKQTVDLDGRNAYEVTKLKNTVSFDIGQVLTKDETHRLTLKANTEIIVSN